MLYFVSTHAQRFPFTSHISYFVLPWMLTIVFTVRNPFTLTVYSFCSKLLKAVFIAVLPQVAQLKRLEEARKLELDYTKRKDDQMLKTKERENELEITRFKEMVEAIGPDTISALSTAGAENNLKMLNALGLSTALITDGSTPINLLNTAYGLIGGTAKMGTEVISKGREKPTSDPIQDNQSELGAEAC